MVIADSCHGRMKLYGAGSRSMFSIVRLLGIDIKVNNTHVRKNKRQILNTALYKRGYRFSMKLFAFQSLQTLKPLLNK